MTGAAIVSLLGGIIALLGPLALPYITVDEDGTVLRSFHVSTGLVSLALALGVIGLGAAIYKKRINKLGWGISLISLGQIGLMALTYSKVWTIVPCKSLELSVCDPTTGGLYDQSLVTLDWGLALVVIGSVIAFFGGLMALIAQPEYGKDQRFLRVMMAWNDEVIAERIYFQPAAVTIGEQRSNHFQLAAKGLDSHVLLTPAGGTDRYTLNVPGDMDGTVRIGGKEASAKGLGATEISRGDSGQFSFDNGVELLFRFTGSESGAVAGVGQRESGLLISFSVVTGLMMVLMVGMIGNLKAHQNKEVEEAIDQRSREIIEIAMEEQKPIEEEIKPEGEEEEKTAKKAGGEEGKFGDPDKDPNKQSKVPKMDGKMTDKIDVKNLGIAKVLGGVQAQQGALGQIMAGDTGALNSKMAVAMNGEGGELVIGAGSGGMGFRGTGSGGGGDGLGRIHGLGEIDTGAGTGRGANIGIGRKTTKKVAKVNIAQGQSTGGCDKGDIAKNVRARAASIKACYESQLLTKPDLKGKLTVQWTITTEGGVQGQKATQDTMSNPTVSDCVLRAISHIKFAKPEAGICVIQWPFVFEPG
jgi:hypothetical protein